MSNANTQLWLEAYNKCRQELIDQKTGPCWVGELSDSALATAVATAALCVYDPVKYRPQIQKAMSWLNADRNEDSGWGDSPDSPSNPTCTTLVAVAKKLADGRDPLAAINYVNQHGGIESTLTRYGKDKTFSAPIMTACAIAGLCKWHDVPSLPLELAALPRWTYKLGPMPVVSYALPALIAIGLAVNENKPDVNSTIYKFRRSLTGKLLKLLESIQPASGGFLEATPLTGFVAMSLTAADCRDSKVTQAAINFLVNSQRDNGAWAIDENLACWNTSLAVGALGKSPQNTLDWIASAQSTHTNEFTNSAPGGWPWTDMPGGVPDADDTAAAIIALSTNNKDKRYDRFILKGTNWLLKLQNSDGGWPTFCRGWGKLPFDRSCCDITAHVLRSLIQSSDVESAPVRKINKALKRGLKFLKRNQQPDGSFLPLWFGSQHRADKANPTIGTARVLRLYDALAGVESPLIVAARQYLLDTASPTGGWGADADSPATIEETALAISALAKSRMLQNCPVVFKGLDYLSECVLNGKLDRPSPVGLYFSQLWYSEKLYPYIWTTEAFTLALSMKNLL